MLCYRCSDSREGVALADRSTRTRIPRQYRDLLARVIGSLPGRIATMVGGDHEQVVRLHAVQKAGNPAVELLERERVTGGVAPMSVERVEIDEIGEQHSAIVDFDSLY